MKRNTIPLHTLFFSKHCPSSSPARKKIRMQQNIICPNPNNNGLRQIPSCKTNSYQLLPSCDHPNKAFILKLDVCLGVSTWHISILTHQNYWRRLAMVRQSQDTDQDQRLYKFHWSLHDLSSDEHEFMCDDSQEPSKKCERFFWLRKLLKGWWWCNSKWPFYPLIGGHLTP